MNFVSRRTSCTGLLSIGCALQYPERLNAKHLATGGPRPESGAMRSLVVAVVWACLLTGCGSDDDVPHAATPAREAGTVDVGGRAMYLDCRGTGTPTVVLEAGLGVAAA